MRARYQFAAIGLLAAALGWVLLTRTDPGLTGGPDPGLAPGAPASAADRGSPGGGDAGVQVPTLLRGWVADERGEPVRGATVVADGALAAEQTDRAGHFELRTGAACPCDVEVSAPHHATIVARGAGPARALQLVLERTATLGGVVEDAEGQPVADATVDIAGGGLWAPRGTESNAEGQFEFLGLPGGVYWVRARNAEGIASGHSAGVIEPGAGGTVALRLAPGVTLTGRVTDAASGQPVAGARVEIGGPEANFPADVVVSDEEGHFQSPALPETEHRVHLQADGYVGTTALRTAGRGTARLRLRRAVTLSGRVLDPAGRPVVGADLEVVGTSRGKPVRVGRAFGGGFGPAPLASSAAAGPGQHAGPDNLGVVPGPVPRLPIVAPASAALGLNAQPAGSRAGGMPPHAAGAAGSAGFTTDADGRFVLAGLPGGRLRVLARHRAHALGRSGVLRARDGDQRRQIEITLGAGADLNGIITDAEDAPVAAARITLEQPGDPDPRTTYSDAKGRFQLQHLDGEYSLTARAGTAPTIVRQVRVSAGGAELRLQLRARASSLRGRAVDARGFPVSDARILVSEAGPNGGDSTAGVTVLSGADGRFEAHGLPPPPHSLRASHVDYADAVADGPGAGGEVELVLRKGHVLRGTVREASTHAALGGALVRYRNTTDFEAGETRTSPDGMFEIRKLSTGIYELITMHAGHSPSTLRVRTAAVPAPLSITLAATGAAGGQVVDALGAPVYDAVVAAGQPPRWDEGTRTDHRGEYVLSGVESGPAHLAARHPEGGVAQLQQAVTIRGGSVAVAEVLRLPARVADPGPAPTGGARAVEGIAATVARRGSELVVNAVVTGSAAAGAGLRVGDRVLAIDGETVFAAGQVRSMWRGAAGSSTRVRIARGTSERTLELTRERYTPPAGSGR